jgi:methionyl-tRNA formyltransferase
MNIVIISQRAPLYLPFFLDKVCKAIKNENINISALVCMSPYTKANLFIELKKRIEFYGFISFIKLSLLIILNKFKALFFKKSKTCYSIDNVIEKYNITEIKTDNVNDSVFIQQLKKLKVDVIVSIACPQIFKKDIIETPNLCCINYHTAMLPKFRGRQPLFWALYHNEKSSGVSVHEMDVKIDNGKILAQKEYLIDENDTLNDLYYKSMEKGLDCLMDSFQVLLKNSDIRIINNAEEASYFSFPTKEEAKEFRKKGKKFI